MSTWWDRDSLRRLSAGGIEFARARRPDLVLDPSHLPSATVRKQFDALNIGRILLRYEKVPWMSDAFRLAEDVALMSRATIDLVGVVPSHQIAISFILAAGLVVPEAEEEEAAQIDCEMGRLVGTASAELSVSRRLVDGGHPGLNLLVRRGEYDVGVDPLARSWRRGFPPRALVGIHFSARRTEAKAYGQGARRDSDGQDERLDPLTRQACRTSLTGDMVRQASAE